MNFEKSLFRIIVEYCVNENETCCFEDLVQDCLKLCTNHQTQDDPTFHLQSSSFDLFGFGVDTIQQAVRISRLMVRQKLWNTPLYSILLGGKMVSLVNCNKQNVIFSDKFLCFIDFWAMSVPIQPHERSTKGTLQQKSFLVEAQFTDAVTGFTLKGLLRGIYEFHTRGQGTILNLNFLQFCALGWMGNPNDMETLKMTLLELFDGSNNNKNEDFHQQFSWWSKKDQETYWHEIQLVWESCLRN